VGWRIGADVVMVVHFAFVVFVVAGGFVAWRWTKVAYVHVPAALYAIVIQVVGFTCPLTPLEKHLRGLARSGGYEGGFIEHYILRVLYPGPLTATVRAGLVAAVLLAMVLAYAGVWYRAVGASQLGDGGGLNQTSRKESRSPNGCW
jgi:hypothetical protein